MKEAEQLSFQLRRIKRIIIVALLRSKIGDLARWISLKKERVYTIRFLLIAVMLFWLFGPILLIDTKLVP